MSTKHYFPLLIPLFLWSGMSFFKNKTFKKGKKILHQQKKNFAKIYKKQSANPNIEISLIFAFVDGKLRWFYYFSTSKILFLPIMLPFPLCPHYCLLGVLPQKYLLPCGNFFLSIIVVKNCCEINLHNYYLFSFLHTKVTKWKKTRRKILICAHIKQAFLSNPPSNW